MAATANNSKAPADDRAGTGTQLASISIEVAAENCTLRYRLVSNRGGGSTGGAGWSEETIGGPGDGSLRRVSAAEAFAVCDANGRGDEVAAATEELIESLFAGDRRQVRDAARLRTELDDGRNGERVVAGPLRSHLARALEAGASLSALARDSGLRLPGGAGDTSALQRRLGIQPHSQRSGRKTWSQTVSYEEAVAIARAVGADPFEVGV